MTVLLFAVGVIFLAGLLSLAGGAERGAARVVALLVPPASLLGFGAACLALAEGGAAIAVLPVPLPLGKCVLQLDPLGAAFLLPVFLLSGLAGMVLPARIRALEEEVHTGRHCFFFCLLSTCMAMVILASDAVFFLLLWEIMSLAPFFLLSHSDRKAGERFAGWIYLVAAHLGALPLLLLMAMMCREAGTSSFAAFFAHPEWSHAGLLFILALIGFGAKSGLFPLHMWMPEAHASAPGHAAVLLSGTMLNVGLYGLFRVLTFLSPGPDWWAYTLIVLGACSGVMGILLGLAQSDMKRTLAYSSAENMGLIIMALGGAMLAGRNNATGAALLLMAGVFFHIWNHSLFKSLLFLGANAVKESIHVTHIRRLGGLQKRMPVTAGCVALGSAAIAGIPPLNGFMGELLIYLGFALGSEATRGGMDCLVFWTAFFLLGAIAGLALFAFARLFGLAFLGTPRGPEVVEAKDPERGLLGVMLVLAALCIGMSLAGPWLLAGLTPLLRSFAAHLHLPLVLGPGSPDMAFGTDVLSWYAGMGAVLLAVSGLIYYGRGVLLGKNGTDAGPTWDCGFRYPTARMQYTGGSFSLSLALILRPLLRPKVKTPTPEGFFPAETKAEMEAPDWPTSVWAALVFRPAAFVAETAKGLQQGLVNIYILYMLIALLAALVWALVWS